MASRDGPMVTGSDGLDYVHREMIAKHYQISWPINKPASEISVNKSRLRKCIFTHLLLALLMVVKLVPDVLDRLDVFVLEIEELEVPPPMKWEIVWLTGSLASALGLSAIRRNRVTLLQVYFTLVNLFSTVPVLLAIMIYFTDFYKFCTEDKIDDIQLWQGYPVAGLWYAFLLTAMQVHIFTLIFTWKLIVAWQYKTTSKKSQ